MTNVSKQQNYTYFYPRKARKATKIESLYAEIESIKTLNKLQKEKIEQLSDLVTKLIEQLAGLGLKVKLEKGKIVLEAAK